MLKKPIEVKIVHETTKQEEKRIKKGILRALSGSGINTKELAKRLVVMCTLLVVFGFIWVEQGGQSQWCVQNDSGNIRCL
jgi:hypothetical protein